MKTEDRYKFLQIFLNNYYECWMEISAYNMQSIPLNLQRALIMINVAIRTRMLNENVDSNFTDGKGYRIVRIRAIRVGVQAKTC